MLLRVYQFHILEFGMMVSPLRQHEPSISLPYMEMEMLLAPLRFELLLDLSMNKSFRKYREVLLFYKCIFCRALVECLQSCCLLCSKSVSDLLRRCPSIFLFCSLLTMFCMFGFHKSLRDSLMLDLL